MPEIRRCCEAGLRRDPSLAGRVELELRIGRRGDAMMDRATVPTNRS
jgi:hypothetical protein